MKNIFLLIPFLNLLIFCSETKKEIEQELVPKLIYSENFDFFNITGNKNSLFLLGKKDIYPDINDKYNYIRNYYITKINQNGKKLIYKKINEELSIKNQKIECKSIKSSKSNILIIYKMNDLLHVAIYDLDLNFIKSKKIINESFESENYVSSIFSNNYIYINSFSCREMNENNSLFYCPEKNIYKFEIEKNNIKKSKVISFNDFNTSVKDKKMRLKSFFINNNKLHVFGENVDWLINDSIKKKSAIFATIDLNNKKISSLEEFNLGISKYNYSENLNFDNNNLYTYVSSKNNIDIFTFDLKKNKFKAKKINSELRYINSIFQKNNQFILFGDILSENNMEKCSNMGRMMYKCRLSKNAIFYYDNALKIKKKTIFGGEKMECIQKVKKIGDTFFILSTEYDKWPISSKTKIYKIKTNA